MAVDTSLLDTKYKNLYDAQLNPLTQQKDSAIQTANTQIDQNNNTYKNLYSGLDQQAQKAADTKYTQSNAVDTGVNQNLNRVQEIMAKNGWLGGGENLQAQLQSNSDRSNNQGKVTTDYNNTIQGVDNSRNQYQGEQANKLQTLQDAIANANNTYGSNVTALGQSIASQKADELSKLQQAEADRQYQADQVAKAQAFQAQQAALSRQASASKVSSPSTAAQQKQQQAADTNATWSELYNQIDNKNGENFLNANRDGIINNLGYDIYNKMLDYAKNYSYSMDENKRFTGRNVNSTPMTY